MAAASDIAPVNVDFQNSASSSYSEWSSFFSITLMSLAMFVGGYLAGLVPLFYSLNEDKIRKLSLFGAGLLVGSALAVIIPEGISTINAASPCIPHDIHMSHAEHGQTLLHVHKEANPHPRKQRAAIFSLEDEQQRVPLQVETHQRKLQGLIDRKSLEPVDAGELGNNPERVPKDLNSKPRASSELETHPEASTDSDHGHMHGEGHQVIGLVLVLGFAFMLLIDQMGEPGHSHSAPPSASNSLSASAGASQLSGALRRSRSITATLGLILHALSDGIALGAAACSGQSHIQAVVFIAIMLHKAPNGFGLVSYLLHEGLDARRIKRHLLFFSCSAPTGAMLTYMFIKSTQHWHRRSRTMALMAASSGNSEASAAQSANEEEQAQTAYITGLAMLFSAGTFLYVATVHVLPEILQQPPTASAHHGELEHGLAALGSPQISSKHARFAWLDLGVLAIGMFLPVLITYLFVH